MKWHKTSCNPKQNISKNIDEFEPIKTTATMTGAADTGKSSTHIFESLNSKEFVNADNTNVTNFVNDDENQISDHHSKQNVLKYLLSNCDKDLNEIGLNVNNIQKDIHFNRTLSNIIHQFKVYCFHLMDSKEDKTEKRKVSIQMLTF